jgi:serine/threonine protein kinase
VRHDAQVSARLGDRTRNIVAVHDAGEHEGRPFLVMEHVPGRTLAGSTRGSRALSR